MPRANRLCSKPGCLAKPISKGRCQEHLFERYAKPWDRKTPYGGTVTPSLKTRVLNEESLCRTCKRNQATEVDHIIPRHLGGTDERENLQGLCCSCHSSKTSAEGHAAMAAKRLRERLDKR